jgi:hypothetical protein
MALAFVFTEVVLRQTMSPAIEEWKIVAGVVGFLPAGVAAAAMASSGGMTLAEALNPAALAVMLRRRIFYC